jgi:hypothetical protein
VFAPKPFVFFKLEITEKLSGWYLICQPNNSHQASASGTSAKRKVLTSTAQKNLPHAKRVYTRIILIKMLLQ